jgi:L-histidine N-alpha-methyltransferase
LGRDVKSATARQLRRPAPSSFLLDVVEGLSAEQKTLKAKYLYDAAGSALFEQITELPEYYPTRTELAILQERADEIVQHIPTWAAFVEFGSGSSTKTRTLLRAATKLAAYVPVDISATFLAQEAKRLKEEFPALAVLPVAADFTQEFDLPRPTRKRPRAGYFSGSTIGNFERDEAAAFLRHAGRILGPGAAMIVGVDRVKDAGVLHAAYNDAAGVTAAFNLNLLARINREIGPTFDLQTFRHEAVYNQRDGRIEMYLISRRAQEVTLLGRRYRFAAGEAIHTENSYKYSLGQFQDLARSAEWLPQRVWTDAERLFSVHELACG